LLEIQALHGTRGIPDELASCGVKAVQGGKGARRVPPLAGQGSKFFCLSFVYAGGSLSIRMSMFYERAYKCSRVA